MSLPLFCLLALTAQTPQNSVSVEVPGLFWKGFEAVGERKVHSNVSVLLALGGRFAGHGDFDSYTLGLGVGVRYWFNRFQLLSDLGGPVIGLRLDGAWTKIAARKTGSGLDTGSAVTSLRFGYRFVILRRVEITPEAGLAFTMGFDRVPWLVVSPRVGGVLGLTAGVVF